MAGIDTKTINRNRNLMENSTIESPYVAQIEDSDADYGEELYDQMPQDKVGLLPANERKRGKR